MIQLKVTLFLIIFFLFSFPNTKTWAFSSSSKKIEVTQKEAAKTNAKVVRLGKKNTLKYCKTSTKKAIFRDKIVKQRKAHYKISLKKKLSILKLVLNNKHHKKATNKQQDRTVKHVLVAIAWAGILGATMSFLTGNIIFGILFSCITFLSLILILFDESLSKFAKSMLWFALGGTILLFFMFAFPILTELLLIFI